MQEYFSTIELHTDAMKFVAGHTTIFSATERESLHGHQYYVYLAIKTLIKNNGMSFDYRYYEKRVCALCKQLHQTFLMPQYSPYLEYTSDENYYYFTFNHKKIPFLQEDVTIIPVCNITIEELARWFVLELTKDTRDLITQNIKKIKVKVSSSPGRSASYTWKR